MKAQILKIAGVKSEKEFYKKYPSEEAFMKVHGKAFKKAQTSNAVEKAQFGNQFSAPNWYQNNQPYGISSTPGAGFNPGNTNIPAGGISAPNAQAFANQSFQTQDPFALNNKVGKRWATNNQLPAGVTDRSVPEDIGFTPQSPAKETSGISSALGALPIIGGIVQGLDAFEQEKDAVKQARQDKAISDVQLKAQQSSKRAQPIERKYVRPEDALTSANQVFPTMGVGTNILKRNGGFVDKAQNGYVTEEKSDLINKYPNAARQKAAIENRKSNQVAFGPQEAPAGYVAPKETETIKAISKPKSKEVWKIWEDTTGTPWSEAKKKGYTDGSAKNNLALADRLLRGEKLTPPGGSKPSAKKQVGKQQTFAQAMASKPKMGKKDFGNIQDPEEDNFITRTGEVLANPLQSYAHYSKYGELPAEGFSKNNKNAYDEVLGAINPAYWVNSAANASDYATEGEYKRAGMEALGALPALGLLKNTKYLPYLQGLPGARNYQRAAKQIGEGAKRLGQGAPKQLGARTVKQLGPGKMKQIGRGPHPNFVMYEDGGEIQNTYAPGTLYDDLGYEPLNDSSMVKGYRHGGHVPQAQSGWSNWLNTINGGGSGFSGVDGASGAGSSLGQYGQIGGNLANAVTGNNAGGAIGGSVGGAVGSIFGPAGSAIGQTAGALIGGFADQNPKEIERLRRQTERNQQTIMLNQKLPAIQAGYASHMKDGGWVSHDWQPQVITQFGDHSMKKLLAPDETMDTLRSGGHISGRYVQPSPSALETMALGGQVKTTWGGHAETISQNPYMPGTGETIMFRGKSHDESDGNGHTGIGVKYGEGGHDSYTDYAEYGSQNADADVEVERNEPAFEMEDPETGEKNLTVLGNLKFDKRIAAQTGDQDIIALSNKYNGKKFKNIGDIISKQEAKENKVIASSTDKLNGLDVNNSFDKLTLSALKANIQGANAKLKGYATDKMNLANFQNAINDSSEEHYLDADSLAQGRGKVNKEAINEARYGTKLEKAQNGKYKVQGKGKKWSFTPAGQTGVAEWDDPGLYVTQWGKSIDDALADKDRADQMIKYMESAPGPEGQKIKEDLASKKTRDEKIKFIKEQSSNSQVGDMHYIIKAARDVTMPKAKAPTTTQTTTAAVATDDQYEVIPYERNKWVDILGQVLPFFRPTDQEGLDPRQLSGEMYALSNNLVDPVQAQTYQPELSSPYDISLQDQMNEITAQTRAAQRMAQGNPEAQALIASNAYDAINKVKGEEFRANQAMKDKVYGENRNTLNDAKIKNLAIYDQQYQRQSQAVSNTKEATQAALNSIADKYGKNKLENRTLGVYENLYNYRYDNAGRAINMNAPQQFNMPYIYGPGGEITHVAQKDEKGNIIGYTEVKKKAGTTTTPAQTKTTPVIPTNNTPATTSPTTTLYSPIVIDYDDPLAPLPGKNGKKLKLAAKNGSIVRAARNL